MALMAMGLWGKTGPLQKMMQLAEAGQQLFGDFVFLGRHFVDGL
jgi:hypothetical protein